MGRVTVSVLVLSYNSERYLERCLQSLKNQTFQNFEVIMVDNASTDGSLEFVRENFPWVKILALEKNYGYGVAYNTSIKQLNSNYVVFLNPDVEVDRDWLKELVNGILKSGHNVKICGSKIFFYDRKNVIQNEGGNITPIGGSVSRNSYKKIGDVENITKNQYVGSVHGASLLVERETFLKLGGFDPDYFMYHDEVDLCWRAWLLGFKVLYVPTSILYHEVGGSSGAKSFTKSPFRVFHERKNQLTNIIKNFSFLNALKGIMLLLIFDILFIFQHFGKGNFKMVNAVLNAYLSTFRQLSSIIKKRRYIQKTRKISDKELKELGVFLPLQECIKEYRRLRSITTDLGGLNISG